MLIVNMKRFAIANLVLLLMLSTVATQSQSDVCHVYVVDVAKAKKAAASFPKPETLTWMRKP